MRSLRCSPAPSIWAIWWPNLSAGPQTAPQRVRPLLLVAAGLLVTALVAAGVTLTVLQLQSRTNTQQVNLRSGVTISEDSAIVQAAAKARPAVVSVVTQRQPTLSRGSGYLATTDGYIVTNIDVIAGAGTMTVLVPGDPTAHDARLVDYDCQTGVAVIKIDKVSGLPTLAFADPTALVQGQLIVTVGGPFEGGAVTPGYVSAMHQVVSIANPSATQHPLELSDTILTSSVINPGTSGGPMLNVGGQVIGIAMQSQASTGTNGFGLNVADVQDDVQQILQTGQVVVSSLGATSTDLSPELASLSGLPMGSQLVTLDQGGPALSAGLQAGDVITQLDDVMLDAAHPLRLLLRSRFHPNQKVTVTYTRGGSSSQAQLTLSGQHPTCT
jgi:putative serine protease PepD